MGDQPDIDARGADEAGLKGVWLDRAGAGGRPELVRITGTRPAPRPPAPRYPFWSAGHLRVMFFLRRGKREKSPEPKAQAKQNSPTGVAFWWAMV